jgi:hypothetical protein
LQGAGPGLAGRRARAVLQGEDLIKIDIYLGIGKT